jgi:sorbitol-6-phosphate 2-dehydrogenase
MDIDESRLSAAAASITESTGAEVIHGRVDVTSEESVTGFIEKTVDRFGRLDIMVCNAGILRAHDIAEFPADDWRRVIDVNLTGAFLCSREAARVMRPRRSGVIIHINSKSGKKGSFRNCAYAASKFGGIGLVQSIALDLAEDNVRVNAVCPGNLLDSPLWVNSLFKQYARTQGISEEEVRRKYVDKVPMKRGCTYDDVCNVVVFLASDESGYMTGQAVNVTGGQEMR